MTQIEGEPAIVPENEASIDDMFAEAGYEDTTPESVEAEVTDALDSEINDILDEEFGEDYDESDQNEKEDDESSDIEEDNEIDEEADESEPTDEDDEILEGDIEVSESDELTSENSFELKVGDETFLAPKEAKITVTVDGEPQEITLQEYANGISGEKAISQRFSALSAEKNELQNRLNDFNQTEDLFRDHMERGEVIQGLDLLFKKSGYSSEAVMEQFFTQVTPALEKFSTMTPEQRQQWSLKVQAERDRTKYEQVVKDKEYLAAEKAQRAQIQQVQQSQNLDDAQFAELAHRLEQEMIDGTLPKQPLNAQLVGNYNQLLIREDLAKQAVSQVAPEYADNQKVVLEVVKAIGQLQQDGHPHELSDVVDIVSQAYGMPAKVEQAKKVEKALNKKGEPKKLSKKRAQAAKTQRSRKGKSGAPQANLIDSMLDELDQANDADDIINKWSK